MDSEYKNYDEQPLKNNMGFVFLASLDYNRIEIDNSNPSKYDDIYNTYKAKIKLTLKIPYDKNNHILDYIITVPADWKTNRPPYLRGLTAEGSIDLDLLNSGKSKLVGWRFYNDVKGRSTKVICTFDLYPKYNKKFTNLKLKFINILNEDIYYIYNLSILNNTNTIEIAWNDITKIEFRNLYKVELTYVDCDGNTVNDYADGTKLWILTTELFNSCYIAGNSDYIENYCFPTTDESKILNAKKIINVEVINPESISIKSEVTYSSEGALLSNNKSIDFTSILTDSLIADGSKLKLKIKNEDLYPSYISLNDLSSVSMKLKQFTELEKDEIYTRLESEGKALFNENIRDYLEITSSSVDNTIKIVSKERTKGDGLKATNLTDVFVRMSEALPYILNHDFDGKKYCGLFPDYDMIGDNFFGNGVFVINSSSEYGLYYTGFRNYLESLSRLQIGLTVTQNGQTGYLCAYNNIPNFDEGNKLYNFAYDEGGSIEHAITFIDVMPLVSSYSSDLNRNLNNNNPKEVIVHKELVDDGFNYFMENTNYPCTWLFALEGPSSLENRYTYKTQINNNNFSSGYLAHNYTILWWKSIDLLQNIKWRACKTLVGNSEIHSISSYENSLNLTKKLFGRDFLFCFIKDTGDSDTGLYMLLDINKFNVYHFPTKFNLNLSFEISSSHGEKSLNSSDKGDKYIKFEANFLNSFEKTVNYEIDHTRNIEDYVRDTAKLTSLIDKYNGRSIDILGNLLNSGKIYIEENGSLIPVANNYFIIGNREEECFVSSDRFKCRYIYCNEDYIQSEKGEIDIGLGRNSGKTCSVNFNQDISLSLFFRNVPLIPQIKVNNV